MSQQLYNIINSFNMFANRYWDFQALLKIFQTLTNESLTLLYNQGVFDGYGINDNWSREQIILYLQTESQNIQMTVNNQLQQILNEYNNLNTMCNNRIQQVQYQLQGCINSQNELRQAIYDEYIEKFNAQQAQWQSLFEQRQREFESEKEQMEMNLKELERQLQFYQEMFEEDPVTFQRLFVDNIKSGSVVCENDTDMLSMETWMEMDENKEIVQLFIDGKGRCYDKELITSRTSEVFTNWVQQPNQAPMDEDGHRGMPGNKRYYKLTLDIGNVFVTKKSLDDNIGKGGKFELKKLDKRRIGNIRGHFEVSGLHGQLPKKQVYRMILKE